MKRKFIDKRFSDQSLRLLKVIERILIQYDNQGLARRVGAGRVKLT